jgi:NADPH:quinone reductase-like Zn-dependent oxidoreductase
MKAIGFYEYGGSEVLKLIEVDNPPLKNDEVTIRMLATSVNRIDILVRQGFHGLNTPMPHIPGIDIVGTVENIGSDVKDFSKGDLVVANTLYGCGSCGMCRAGDEVLCNGWKDFGLHVWGSYGELVNVPSKTLIMPPKAFSTAELAAMPVALGVSWRCLNTLARARSGETVFVWGATGNVGLFSTILSKSMGLRVIGISRSKEKAEALKKAGADYVVDGNKDDDSIVKEVQAFTKENGGVDVVIEPFGATLASSIKMVRNGGRIALFGVLRGDTPTISAKFTYLKSVSILGTHNSTRKELSDAMQFMAYKSLKPVIGKTLKLTEAGKAQDMLSKSEVFGKIILQHDI